MQSDTFAVATVAANSHGVLLISGILRRVAILDAWAPFNPGVPFLPPQELLGHLPIMGILYVLLTRDPDSLSAQWVHEDG